MCPLWILFFCASWDHTSRTHPFLCPQLLMISLNGNWWWPCPQFSFTSIKFLCLLIYIGTTTWISTISTIHKRTSNMINLPLLFFMTTSVGGVIKKIIWYLYLEHSRTTKWCYMKKVPILEAYVCMCCACVCSACNQISLSYCPCKQSTLTSDTKNAFVVCAQHACKQSTYNGVHPKTQMINA